MGVSPLQVPCWNEGGGWEYDNHIISKGGITTVAVVSCFEKILRKNSS